ncbi:MAG: adenylate/guanylate cyclase domain-containing protein [Leptospirales bacterium]
MGFFSKINKAVLGNKINNVRVVPVATKIIITFTIIILVSNFTSNYINVMSNRVELVNLMRTVLEKDMKDMYLFANTQHEIYKINGDRSGSLEKIEDKGNSELEKDKSIVLGVQPEGKVLFQASKIKRYENFTDTEQLNDLNEQLAEFKSQKQIAEDSGQNSTISTPSGFISMHFNDEEYFAAYKYNEKWDVFLIRGEEVNQFYENSRSIFQTISIIIILITFASSVIGVFLLRSILRLIGVITTNIMRMVESQNLDLIDMKGATNDDVSYLGYAFNTLSSTVNNLVTIFRKFANRDVVIKAYRDKEVKLEGVQKELTIVFSDIKSFTFITETLGTDIIKLLNLHYDNAIRSIVEHDGVIGAIIGDALLAVYGAMEELEGSAQNKSLQAVKSSYKIQELAKALRDSMVAKKDQLIKKKKKLSRTEEKVYKAVLIEVGVGIDGGEVFYGTIGSYVRMTNTVIGDNVNAASRLEGLTRIYHLPVICSEYVKNDIERNVDGVPIIFMEIDTVQVKGKTIGKKVFWPIQEEHYTPKVKKEVAIFEDALQHYYSGKWQKANPLFKKCKLAVAKEFAMRTSGKSPKNWNGIWEMKTK